MKHNNPPKISLPPIDTTADQGIITTPLLEIPDANTRPDPLRDLIGQRVAQSMLPVALTEMSNRGVILSPKLAEEILTYSYVMFRAGWETCYAISNADVDIAELANTELTDIEVSARINAVGNADAKTNQPN